MDGQSERTNQSMEIAFRFMMSTLKDPTDWPSLVGPIQRNTNNSRSAATEKTSNEIVSGFTPVRSLDFTKITPESFLTPKLVRMEAADAIAFAQTNAKMTYDQKHQSISFKVGEHALLRLHKSYNISSAAYLGRK